MHSAKIRVYLAGHGRVSELRVKIARAVVANRIMKKVMGSLDLGDMRLYYLGNGTKTKFLYLLLESITYAAHCLDIISKIPELFA